jgi:hypothetical protein
MVLFNNDYNLTDFTNGLDRINLFNEIVSNINITAELQNIIKQQDLIKINFKTQLTSSEIIELDSVVANHNIVVVPEIVYDIQVVLTSDTQIKSNSYKLLHKYRYLGTIYNNISRIQFLETWENNLDDYSIKVVDVSNNQILLEETIQNDNQLLHSFVNLANIPITDAVIEIHIKSDETKFIIMNTVILYLI